MESLSTNVPGSALFTLHSQAATNDVNDAATFEVGYKPINSNTWTLSKQFTSIINEEERYVLITGLKASSTYSFRQRYVYLEGPSEYSKATTVAIGKQSIRVFSTQGFTPPRSLTSRAVNPQFSLLSFSLQVWSLHFCNQCAKFCAASNGVFQRVASNQHAIHFWKNNCSIYRMCQAPRTPEWQAWHWAQQPQRYPDLPNLCMQWRLCPCGSKCGSLSRWWQVDKVSNLQER